MMTMMTATSRGTMLATLAMVLLTACGISRLPAQEACARAEQERRASLGR